MPYKKLRKSRTKRTVLKPYSTRRPGVIMTAVIAILIIVTLSLDTYRKKRQFPFFRFEENYLTVYEVTYPDNSVDTVSGRYTVLNKFIMNKSKHAYYIEDTDSIAETYSFSLKKVEAKMSHPFFKALSLKDTLYNITLSKFPLSEGDQWEDKRAGLLHRFSEIDTITMGDSILPAIKIERFLNTKARIELTKELLVGDSSYNDSVRSVINSVWIDWYTPNYGRIMTVYPSGEKQVMIENRKIWWAERFLRYLFGYGY